MRIPVATYRLQFSSEFQFHHAEKIVPYLQLLGISDIYASPIFKARSGSTHGYDIVDPRQLNPELGTDADFERLIQALHQQNMGWLQDIVPNHMAYSSQNPFLMDLMEHGPDSDYFDFFDVQWEHPYADIQGKILTPLLGDFYGNCLEKGELTLHYDETGLKIHYYDLKLPLRIESYTQLITHDIGRLARTLGRQHPDYIKLLGVLYMLKHAIAETAGQQRQDQVTFIKGLLWELHQTNDDIRSFIDHNVKLFNGDVNDPASFDLLDEMLSDQFFRLSYWKVGAEELNYRRFFTVNELISVNVQDREVFQTTHELIQTLVDEGKFTGVRIDHIDGLYNPQQYLEWLRDSLGDIYITVEKILESGEQLPSTWPIAGTSGYNFLNTVNRVFCQPQHGDDFTRIYQHYTGLYDDFETMAEEKKQVIAETNLAGDIENLANHLKSIARRYRYASDFTLNGLRRAITEVLVLFPVYRTYITPAGIADRDRAYVNRVMKVAKQRNPWLVNELDFIHKLVLLDYEDWLTTEEREQWEDFVLRLQQSSGPLTAKGIEDTALYVYNRFLSLNEVGGSPHQFGITVKQFHAHHRYQAEHWPHAMNASSTHDTKRSEDLRARLNVLSEIPADWQAEVETWRAINSSQRVQAEDRLIPDVNDEYFLYQTLVGVFPFEPYDHQTLCDRVKNYVTKAVREAKVHTAWLRPDTEYEEGFLTFIDRLLAPGEDNSFLPKLKSFQQRIAAYGIFNSLSQLLIKLTAPGVPDIYQGTELWDLSLVDPDNRRPVDFEARLHMVKEMRDRASTDLAALISDLQQQRQDGRIKLFLMMQVLAARSRYLDIFQQGSYIPIKTAGTYQDHIIAFARQHQNRVALTIVPRFLTALMPPDAVPVGSDIWQDTKIEVPNGDQVNWVDAVTQTSIKGDSVLMIGEMLQQFPGALLISQ